MSNFSMSHTSCITDINLGSSCNSKMRGIKVSAGFASVLWRLRPVHEVDKMGCCVTV